MEFVTCTAAVSMYTFIGFIYDGLQVVLAQAIGLHVAPQFNKPYMAESLASFWGKRWNLPMGICLRQAVYEPISQGLQAQTLHKSVILSAGHYVS